MRRAIKVGLWVCQSDFGDFLRKNFYRVEGLNCPWQQVLLLVYFCLLKFSFLLWNFFLFSKSCTEMNILNINTIFLSFHRLFNLLNFGKTETSDYNVPQISNVAPQRVTCLQMLL